jgi:hypothetical protein
MTQEDDFDELDDEKLPVLKNIYSNVLQRYDLE